MRMKKRIIAILALALGAGLVFGVPSLVRPGVKPISTGIDLGNMYLRKQPLPKDEKGHSYRPIKDHIGFIEQHAKGTEAGKLDVPVYYESEMIPFNGCFSFFGDSGYYAGFSFGYEFFSTIVSHFPTTAIRKGVDGHSIYVMYDTQTGLRLYCFFSYEKTEYRAKDGYGVIIRKGQNLAFADFDNVRHGTEISEVQRIDPLICFYRTVFDAINEKAMADDIKIGMPPTSIHYLKDGILKIEYMRISGRYFVTRMVYNKDYTLDGLSGSTCYKIADIDNVAEK